MKTVLKTAKYLLIAVYVTCGVAAAVFLLPRTGWRALNVATGSMAPAIPTGSLVIIHHVPYSQIRVGDVITFINPANAKQTITHRVVKAQTIVGLPGFVTKGDANQNDDQAILGGNVVGKITWHIPAVGRWLSAVRQPIWIILLVAIPGLLIITDELRRLVRTLVMDENSKHAGKIEPLVGEMKTVEQPALIEVKKKVPVLSRAVVPKPRKRGMDGIVHLALVLALMTWGVGVTRANLAAKASLIGNTISTAVGSGAGGSCGGGNDSTSIGNTGPGSVNNVSITHNCTITTTNTTTINVSNSTNQTAVSGAVGGSGNTGSGGDASGSAGNGSSSNTQVGVSNY